MVTFSELRPRLAKRWPAFKVAEVARRVGVTERTYRRWERGDMSPSRRHARALAREVRDLAKEKQALDALDALDRL